MQIDDFLGTPLSHVFQGISSILTVAESNTSSTQRKSRNEWVLCLENWEDFVIIHIPQLNTTPVENNYAHLFDKRNQKYIFPEQSPQEITSEKIEIE